MTVLAQRIRRYVELSGRTEGAVWLARTRAAIDSGQDLSAADLAAAIALLLPLTPADFALRCGREERLSDLGTVGHAIASSRTLEQALSIWSAHSGDIDPLMHFRIHVRSESWRTEFTASADLSPAVRRFLAEEWLSNFFTFLKEVTALVDPAARIELRHPPAIGLAYDCWLPVRPEFRRAANRLTLPRRLLATPLRSRNDEMLDLIMRHFRDRPAAPAPWSEQVRRTLTSHAADTHTLAACAAALGVSDRTLVRRMAAEGTRFGAVLDDHRRDLAMILARNNDMTAKDIARAVGFDSHQSLRRAFLRWTGLPLGRWRSGQADAPVQQQPS